jgi:hypothetical protein
MERMALQSLRKVFGKLCDCLTYLRSSGSFCWMLMVYGIVLFVCCGCGTLSCTVRGKQTEGVREQRCCGGGVGNVLCG